MIHISKKGMIIIVICCTIIVLSYFNYKKLHSTPPVVPSTKAVTHENSTTSTQPIEISTTTEPTQ